MPSDLPTLRTAAMPMIRTQDDELPWVFGKKPGGILLLEDAFSLLQENGDLLLWESGDTKSQVVRTGDMPPVRTANG